MSQKRKPLVLDIRQKYHIIRMFDTGAYAQIIMEKYNISQPTLFRILARREDIRERFETSTMGNIRSARLIQLHAMKYVDEIVYRWYLRCKEKKIRMTREDIQSKALEINEKLNGHPCFKASTTWMEGFQDRYRITNEDITEVSSTVTDHFLVEASVASFNKLLQVCGYSLKNVYNVVYTALVWKALPKKTLIWRRAKLTGNLKMCEDYVIALLCANATGCHKLPILIIGNAPETQSLYSFNTEPLPIIYRSKTNVCMDSTIFTQWYKEYFLESVKIKQESENGYREKCLLLLDNVRLFRNLHTLNVIDPFVTVMSPPPDVSRLIQPMNCGIITCFKRKYRQELLEAIKPISIYNTEEGTIDLYKKLNMWDCCRIALVAWYCVDDAILIHSWDDLLQREMMLSEEYSGKWTADVSKAVQMLHNIPGCEMCEETDVLQWYHIDNDNNTAMMICTDEVLEEFKNHTPGQPLNINIINDQAGPSHS